MPWTEMQDVAGVLEEPPEGTQKVRGHDRTYGEIRDGFDSVRDSCALFDEIDTMIEEGRERDLEAGLDPAVAARLDAIAGADDAPYEFRELHRRVRERSLTWEEFWLAPQDEPGGHDLVHAAMKAEGAELATLLRAVDDQPPPGSGVLGR